MAEPRPPTENKRPPAEDNKDPLLSLAAHEFRGVASVILGWMRMVLGERMGPLPEKPRSMLQEVEKSAKRLSVLSNELSELSLLEGGGAVFNRGSVNLASLIAEQSGTLALADQREITFTFRNHAPDATLHGDPVRLKHALHALFYALARELVTSNELCVSLRRTSRDGQPMLQLTIAGDDRLDEIERASADGMAPFDEYKRGGVGFSLPIAHRIVRAHDGELWSPRDHSNAGAIVLLPEGGKT